MKKAAAVLVQLFFFSVVFSAFPQAIIIDHTCTDLSRIPQYWLEQAKQLTLHYAHTSHGSQVTSGVLNLESLDTYYSVAIRTSSSEGLPPAEDPPALRIYDGNPPETYIQPNDYWEGAGAWARTTSVAATGNYDFSMWSWCGQVSYYSSTQINDYLYRLNQFENEFPGMRFIYMTGHLDGGGSGGTLHQQNEMIRNYCRNNNKVLFDFADIERYDPGGVDYLDLGADDNCDYDNGNWAQEWCAAHSGSDLCDACSCAHSQSLNCNLKGRAFWWMMARLAGWSGETSPTATPTGPPGTPTPTPTPVCSPCQVEARGAVYDSLTLQPIEGAFVELTGADWQHEWYGNDFTDQSGDYWILGGSCCGAGTGSIRAGAWGYHTGMEIISSCSSNYIDFQLDPVTPPPPFPAIDRGDYNGDGTSDVAIYRGITGLWAIRGLTRVYYGFAGDQPVSGDYDGDGTCEIGVYRSASGLWAIRGLTRIYFGSSLDDPVPGDYSGSGQTHPALFSKGSGRWTLKDLSTFYFGASEDLPAPSDYDGDERKDVAIFRQSSGLWAVRGLTRIYFGKAGDLPVPCDFDGDGSDEVAIFREESGLWAVRGITRFYFGRNGDAPVPADFNGDSIRDGTIFRSSSGLWAVRGITRTYYGLSGDIPITR